MSVLAKVFVFIFVALAVVGFVTLLGMIEKNGGAADATVNSSYNAYYDTQQQVNQSINQTVQYGKIATAGLSGLPILTMIFCVGCALLLFLTVVKRR
ncbi:MAG: hypothetical protein PHC39_04555 [Proteiniphilum sp.]|nr:hypothetical protein [Proteiniphilum sp.]